MIFLKLSKYFFFHSLFVAVRTKAALCVYSLKIFLTEKSILKFTIDNVEFRVTLKLKSHDARLLTSSSFALFHLCSHLFFSLYYENLSNSRFIMTMIWFLYFSKAVSPRGS